LTRSFVSREVVAQLREVLAVALSDPCDACGGGDASWIGASFCGGALLLLLLPLSAVVSVTRS
jgi:hypothetical protein